MPAHLGPDSLKRLLQRRQVARNRDVFCSRYEQCLDEALDHGWVSWTCAHCVRFAPGCQAETAIADSARIARVELRTQAFRG